MAIEGEFSTTLEVLKCDDCAYSMPLEVLQTPAGFYIGRFCVGCGPYERCSDYFPTREAAEAELELWKSNDVRPSGRDTNFHG